MWFVADKRKTPQQWRAWIAYFAWLDDQTTPKGGKAATFRKLEKLTVPTEWPLEFDSTAPPAPLAEPKEEPTRNRRRELGAMMHDLAASMAMPDAPRPTNWRDMTPAQAGDRLAERSATYAAVPPTASAELMEKYLRPPQEGLDDAVDF